MVKVYDNIIPDDVCQKLIGIFETNVQHQHFINENNCPCFTQVNLNQVSSDNVRLLIPFLADVYQRYRKDTKNFYSPPLKELEEFRIKRYNTSGDERFDEHVDVTDYSSARRALAFLFYLNDNDGDTYFPDHQLIVHPKAGRVLVFPPTWEYPHIGYSPKTQKKYIMSTYLHYGQN